MKAVQKVDTRVEVSAVLWATGKMRTSKMIDC